MELVTTNEKNEKLSCNIIQEPSEKPTKSHENIVNKKLNECMRRFNDLKSSHVPLLCIVENFKDIYNEWKLTSPYHEEIHVQTLKHLVEELVQKVSHFFKNEERDWMKTFIKTLSQISIDLQNLPSCTPARNLLQQQTSSLSSFESQNEMKSSNKICNACNSGEVNDKNIVELLERLKILSVDLNEELFSAALCTSCSDKEDYALKLVEIGADPFMVDKYGDSPFSLVLGEENIYLAKEWVSKFVQGSKYQDLEKALNDDDLVFLTYIASNIAKKNNTLVDFFRLKEGSVGVEMVFEEVIEFIETLGGERDDFIDCYQCYD